MSQARVTDFFTRSKRGVNARALGAKGTLNDVLEPEIQKAEIRKVSTRSARARSKSATRPSKTRSTSSKRSAENEPTVEPGQVLALSASGVETPAQDVPVEESAKRELDAPRTPKRTSAEAEFDLGPEVFPAAVGHSSSKKRAVIHADSGSSTPVFKSPAVKGERKSARKKLVLSREQEQVIEPVSKPSPSGEKEVRGLASISGNSSPVGKPATASPQLPGPGKKAFSKDDVAVLKSRLQKIQEQREKGSPPPRVSGIGALDVKATLARARELGERAKQRREEKGVDDLKAGTERPSKAQDRETVPAYQRYHTLAQDVPPGLHLPFKFKVLAEMFRSMDTIVGMLFNRSETVTFSKVKQGVQDMTHKRFEESHIGQIKAVYPSAYTFRQEKNIPTFSATARKSSYQLTMEPVINHEKGGMRPQLTASHLLERRRLFHQNLVQIVKRHHKEFLASLNPPLSVPDERLTRWHPRFNADDVPNIVPCQLPQPPHTDKLTTAQEVLDKARSLMTPKMEKALANMALKTAEMAYAEGVASPERTVPAPLETPSALRGVSQALLERIRAKEAQKVQTAMTCNPEQEERLLMMSRLAEMARILRNVFVAEKKPALIMEVVCNRMMSSYRSALSSGEMEKHLRLLAELAAEWLTIHPIRKDFYLKLNKTMDLNVVLETLRQKTEEEARC